MAVAIELWTPQAGLHLVPPDAEAISPTLTVVHSTPDSPLDPEVPVTPIVVDKDISKVHQTIVFEAVISLKGGQDYSRLLNKAEPYIEPPITSPLVSSFSIYDQADIM